MASGRDIHRMCTALLYRSVECIFVKYKPTRAHEVDFIIGNRRDYLQNLMSQKEAQGGRGGGAV